MSDITPTWDARELPMLRIAIREAEANSQAELNDIAAELGLDYMTVRNAAKALEADGYFKLYLPGGMVDGCVWEVHAKARRAVEQWPSTDALVDLLVRA